MKEFHSRMTGVVALSLAFAAHAGATAMYDYKPGELLVIDGGTSPDKSQVLNTQPVKEQKTKE